MQKKELAHKKSYAFHKVVYLISVNGLWNKYAGQSGNG